MRQIFAVLIFLIFLTGCAALQPFHTQKPLTVGMSTNYPPIAFSVDGIPAGVEADFAALLAKELQRDLNIKVLPWSQQATALQSGAIDIVMAGVSVTQERMRHALFCDPYMRTSQMALMRDDTPAPNYMTHGRGTRIGYIFSTTGETFVKETFEAAQFKGYTEHKRAIAGVMNGEIDYFFHDAPVIWHYTAEMAVKGIIGWYVPYTAEHLAWAVAPRNAALQQRINTIIKKWQQDGTIARVLNKWIEVTIVTPGSEAPMRFE